MQPADASPDQVDLAPERALRASLAGLVLANVVPAIGVLALDWNPYQLLLLYWFESLVLGILNLPKLAMCRTQSGPDKGPGDPAAMVREFGVVPTSQLAKLPLMLFFCVHYGIFMFVHLMFITVLSVDEFSAGAPGEALTRAFAFLGDRATQLGLAAFAASHVLSFAVHFLGRGEFRRTTVHQQMLAIYPRIVVMHIAIILGAALVQILGLASGVLLVLVVGKTALDIRAHRREHKASTLA